MLFLSESSAVISLTFTNSKPMKRTLDRTQPPDRLQGQDPPGAGCQDAADAAAWKPAPNTIHSRAGTKQESRQISPQKSHHEHKKTASESQFGSLLIKLEPQARTLLQPRYSKVGLHPSCSLWKRSRLQLLCHRSGRARSLERTHLATARDPDMMTFLMGLGEEPGLKGSLCKVKGSLHSRPGEQDLKPSLW